MELKRLQKEIDTLKESNENHIFINEKLNKALKRAEQRNEQLSAKLKTVTDQSVVLKKEIAEIHIERQQKQTSIVEDPPFLGDVSSIYVKADMI